MADPWREGFQAHQREESIGSNPYRKATDEWPRWIRGWLDAAGHEADKAAALDSIGWNG